MNGRVPAGVYSVRVNVYDAVWDINAVSTVKIVIKDIEEEAVLNSGSLRLQGNYYNLWVHPKVWWSSWPRFDLKRTWVHHSVRSQSVLTTFMDTHIIAKGQCDEKAQSAMSRVYGKVTGENSFICGLHTSLFRHQNSDITHNKIKKTKQKITTRWSDHLVWG